MWSNRPREIRMLMSRHDDPGNTERLIVSLSRLLDPAAALRAMAGSDLSFLGSRPWGVPMCSTGCGAGWASTPR